ncbi:MAG: hypothetical protein ACR2NW_06875 [Thermodesulfobacteriota bacterium]
MDKFEEIEYKQCLASLKYYDDRHLSLLKFATGISSAVPPVIFALYNLDVETDLDYWNFVTFLSLITALGLSALFVAMIQNRLNFIYPARQVNSIRKSQFLGKNPPLFQNQMYTDIDIKAFKWMSSQTLMNLFVSFQISFFLGMTHFSMSIEEFTNTSTIYCSLSVVILSALVIFGISSLYLSIKSKYHPGINVD